MNGTRRKLLKGGKRKKTYQNQQGGNSSSQQQQQQQQHGSSTPTISHQTVIFRLAQLLILCLIAIAFYYTQETVAPRNVSITFGSSTADTTTGDGTTSSSNLRVAPVDAPLLGTKHLTASSSSSSSGGGGAGKKWDSSKCAVMGLATGYGLQDYQRFVGSLRATGYPGHIILGIAADAPDDVLAYLKKHRVTTYIVKVTQGPGGCTYFNATTVDGIRSIEQKCSEAYPDYKIQWGRFPLARDWLTRCQECTDGVMLTDVRDAYFQSDPFVYIENPPPLMLFEEVFPENSAAHWLTEVPVRKCRNFQFTEKHPMLCSGSTMGSREGILEYLQVMVEEMDYWKQRVECRSDMIGDDQSIHNYLYYANKLPKDTVAYPHRTGPINVIGVEANLIFRAAIKKVFEEGGGDGGRFKDRYDAEGYINHNRFYGSAEGNKWHQWLGPEHKLIDPETGHILNLDGKWSPQVHQYDRFSGPFIVHWLDRMVRRWNKQLDEKLQQQQQ